MCRSNVAPVRGFRTEYRVGADRCSLQTRARIDGLLVAGCLLLVACCLFLVVGRWSLVAGHWQFQIEMGVRRSKGGVI